MKDYQVMPELSADEYNELKQDIADRGVMVPIEFDEDGNCLDGHHRLKICKELGITGYPTVRRAGMTEEEKFEHALLANVARRNLSPSDKNFVANRLMQKHPEFSFRRLAGILGISEATARRFAPASNDAPANHEGLDGKQYPSSEKQAEKQRKDIRNMIQDKPNLNNHQIAQAIGASDHTVAKQRKIVSVFNPSKRDADALKDPDIQRRLSENSGMNVAGAIREQKRDELVEHLESVETKEAKAVEGVYDVIVIDPPWPMQKIETDRRPLEIHMDYPVMSIGEIKGLKIPAADPCHIFLWTTQKFLPEAFEVLKTWNVKYVCSFVWHKVGGYKPLDLPRYNCEFCLYAHKGAPRFIDDHQFWTCNDWEIGGHSEKPDGFYEMLRRVTAGRRLDMFNRRTIEGFDGWGKEAINNG